MDDHMFFSRVDARVHYLGIVSWSCKIVCNEIDVIWACNVEDIAARFNEFHIGTYSFLLDYCQRGRRYS